MVAEVATTKPAIKVTRAVSSVDRAPALHAGCRRFESVTAHRPSRLRHFGRQASLIAREGRPTTSLVKTNIHRRPWRRPPTGLQRDRPQRPGLPSHRFFEFLGRAEGDLLAGLDLDRFAGR